jgi:hypothetical protein
MNSDRDLEERFEQLRDEDAHVSAPASQVLSRVRARQDEERGEKGLPARVWLVTGIAIAGALALWLAGPLGGPPASEHVLAPELSKRQLAELGSLRMPTDSLLEIGQIHMLGDRPPELLPLPELPKLPVRESHARRNALS